MTGAAELDLDAARRRAQAALQARRPGTSLGPLERLPGGISSLTFAATASGGGGEHRVVVKVAPPGLPPVRNRDVLRQARVLEAVHGAPGVHVPEVLGSDAGAPPLFVMEHVSGDAYEPRWDHVAEPPPPPVVAARARAAARMLARLQAISPAAAGLGDEPVLSLAEELERWARLYATAGDELRGDEAELRDALARRPPDPAPAPAILHGDYRLGNMQFTGTRLAAVIDWEIWSLGDPRTDLAWLMMFCDPVMERTAARDAPNAAAAAAMPDGGELLAEYLAETDPPGTPAGAGRPAELDWFLALALYKLGATMAVLAKRNRRQSQPDPTLERAAETTPAMLERARALLG